MATIEQRTTKSGQISFRAKVRIKGHQSKSATFTRKTDARRWVEKIQSEIREGKKSTPISGKKRTFSEARERYAKYMALENPDRLAEITIMLDWWEAHLGPLTLGSITKSLIAEKRDLLMQEEVKRGRKFIRRSGATVNRYITVLKTLFNHACDHWEWLDESPIRKLSNLSESKGRNRYLDKLELTRLLAACRNSANKYLYAIVVLAISTGARKNEINCIKWNDIDFERQTILLSNTKNGENRILPLKSEALREFRRLYQERGCSGYVFASSKKAGKPIEFKTAWYTVLRKAKLVDFKFHDLRHTTASYLAMDGANTKDIAYVLGHKSLAMTNRYAHLCENHTSSVVERMNEGIFSTGELAG